MMSVYLPNKIKITVMKQCGVGRESLSNGTNKESNNGNSVYYKSFI